MSNQRGSSLWMKFSPLLIRYVHICNATKNLQVRKVWLSPKILLVRDDVMDTLSRAPIDEMWLLPLPQYIFGMFFSCNMAWAISRIGRFFCSTTLFCCGVYRQETIPNESPSLLERQRTRLRSTLGHYRFISIISWDSSHFPLDSLTWESERRPDFSTSLSISRYAVNNHQWRYQSTYTHRLSCSEWSPGYVSVDGIQHAFSHIPFTREWMPMLLASHTLSRLFEVNHGNLFSRKCVCSCYSSGTARDLDYGRCKG